MEQISIKSDYDRYFYYLNSEVWASKRNEALIRDNFECSICHSPYNLEVHHLKYPDVLGTESISDLMTLCRDCHKKLEDWKKGHRISRRIAYWEAPQVSVYNSEPTNLPESKDFPHLFIKVPSKEQGNSFWGSVLFGFEPDSSETDDRYKVTIFVDSPDGKYISTRDFTKKEMNYIKEFAEEFNYETVLKED
jgi:hypothetical protein